MRYFLQDFYDLRIYFHFTSLYLQAVLDQKVLPDESCSFEMGLYNEASLEQMHVPIVVQILAQMDTPSVEELQESRLGKVLNKISKKVDQFDESTIQVAKETTERWKQQLQIQEKQNPAVLMPSQAQLSETPPINQKKKKSVTFAEENKENDLNSIANETALVSRAYYCLSDKRVKFYSEKDNSHRLTAFKDQFFSLKQLGLLYPSLFHFLRVEDFK